MPTKAFAKAMMEHRPDARPTDCTILAHCRTRVFQFPSAHLVAEQPPEPAVIMERPGAKATVVSDLLDYFENCTPFPHFRICCSLRSKIDGVLAQRAKDARIDHFPLFLVIEQETQCRTPLEDGQSYIVDQSLVTGGLEGEHIIMAWKADDAPWPEIDENDSGFINTALAAVKIVQNETDVIREEADSSCFYDEDYRVVYTITMESNISLSKSSARTASQLQDLLDTLCKLTKALEQERSEDPERIDTLVDALRLEKIETEHYRCAWYLSLFEATKAMLSAQAQQQFNQRHRAYRKTIGHPKPHTKIDINEFRRLQRDAMDQLRTIFLQT
ncbi:MAG: hypothetical protein F4114_12545 [Rhodospirillaceae bacterium]|nr:hypothetical protein [Rhodospirillaceae bacterium]MYB12282.1 hypothetical protein [Rhodospirillaceae bacterium]MYI49898.1 hypothetical protein [Rhodospirillaceae bacterium]